jgi:hypothetical protein
MLLFFHTPLLIPLLRLLFLQILPVQLLCNGAHVRVLHNRLDLHLLVKICVDAERNRLAILIASHVGTVIRMHVFPSRQRPKNLLVRGRCGIEENSRSWR